MKKLLIAITLMLSLNVFSQNSGIIITTSNDTIITYGYVNISMGKTHYQNIDRVDFKIDNDLVKEFKNIDQLIKERNDNVTALYEGSLTKEQLAGRRLKEAGESQNLVLETRAIGTTFVIAGSGLAILGKGSIPSLIGAAACNVVGLGFYIASIVHQVKANNAIRKAGIILESHN